MSQNKQSLTQYFKELKENVSDISIKARLLNEKSNMNFLNYFINKKIHTGNRINKICVKVAVFRTGLNVKVVLRFKKIQ